MGILEVHDGGNRVERVKFTRENPVLFGTSPMCDIVLSGPGIAPFHGRIRWADRRFKIDAGADVPSLDVNGKPLRSSTLYQGDEITVGAWRIFVISVGDGTAEPAGEERTKILDNPAAFAAAASSAPSRANPKPPPAARAQDAPAFEFNLDDEDAEEAAPTPPPRKGKEKADFAAGTPLQRGRGSRRAAPAEPVVPSVMLGPPPTFLDKIKSYLPKGDAPPGQEKVLTSPIVLGLAGTLIVLVFLSISLWRGISRANADKGYNRAVESLNDGDYPNAIVRFDEFLNGYSGDPRANKAKVLRAMARVRQHTGTAGASWTVALQASQEMVDEVGHLPEFADVENELGEQLIKVVENQAERARAMADPKPLEEVDAALALHGKILGGGAAKQLERSKGRAKIAEAKAAILKANTRAAGLAAMDKALGEKKPTAVYDARDKLVDSYPDQSSDKELIGRLIKANELILGDAKSDGATRSGQTTPRDDPLGPPVSFVLRSNPGVPSSGGPVVYALADGLAVGLDGATGTPLWMTPVGLASPFTPQAITGGEPSALAFDSRHDELVRLDGRTGKLVWRQEIKERVTDPPTIIGNQIFQATPSGKILMLDLRSGNLLGSLDLGRPLARGPVVDETGEHLYILGDEDCLFVLNRNPLACVGVEYLGHDAGSIGCPPARVGRFIIVPENLELNAGRWRVLLLDEQGLNPKVVQTVPIAGWTFSPPKDVGAILWSVSDRNEVTAFTIGLYDSPEPLKVLARLAPDNESSGTAYDLSKSDREVWVASGRTSRHDLAPDTGKLNPAWTVGNIGPASAPIQEAGGLAVFTHQAERMPGITLRGVDPAKGEIRWTTILGAPFPVAVEPSPGGAGLRTLGISGDALNIPIDLARKGGFVEGQIPAPGGFSLPPTGDLWLPVEGPTVVVPGKKADKFIVKRDNVFTPLALPAPLQADPILWGKDVFLPGNDGRAYLIDPHSGEATADPFVPPFDKAHPSLWRNPVMLIDDALALVDEEGHMRRVIRATNPRPHLEITADAKLPAPLAAEMASTGGAVIALTTAGEVRAYAARDLSPLGNWPLEAPRAAGPVSAGGHAFVGDASGNVLAFGPEGKRLWGVKLKGIMALGAPAVKDGVVWFLTRTGGLEGRALADGSSRGQVSLGVLPTGGVIDLGADRFVPSGRGTIRLLRPDLAKEEGKP